MRLGGREGRVDLGGSAVVTHVGCWWWDAVGRERDVGRLETARSIQANVVYVTVSFQEKSSRDREEMNMKWTAWTRVGAL